ncbi:MAG: N-acetylmuramic acid 6-phosphate etherase [Paracoccaceae bacterium]
MSAVNTEKLHHHAIGLDTQPLTAIAAILADGQIAAAQATHGPLEDISKAARAMAETLREGGVLYYVAAGSSGLMAAADAMELGGTFGIPASQIRILMAGGLPKSAEMPGDTEDATDSLNAELAHLTANDSVIAVSASGSTPYTMAAAKIARQNGATVIGIANNAGTPLLAASDHAIALETPPEVLSGSTRMGAGTAQKIALNMMSTLMAVDLGHVHDGMMVNLRADNDKLRGRAAGIVATVSGVEPKAAAQALDATDGDVKLATLLACGAKNPSEAQALLSETAGHLRPAMARLSG